MLKMVLQKGTAGHQQLISLACCGREELSLGGGLLAAASSAVGTACIQPPISCKDNWPWDEKTTTTTTFLDDLENNTASPVMSIRSIFTKPKFASPGTVEPTE